MSDQGKANYEAYRKLAGRPGVSAHPLPDYEQLPMELRYAFDAGADAVEAWLADAPVDEDAPGNEPAKVMRFVDRRCGHEWCEKRGAYRMIGGCFNCRTEPLLGLFTVTHEASGGDCPVCGCAQLHWDRLATPDEIPADFEAHQ